MAIKFGPGGLQSYDPLAAFKKKKKPVPVEKRRGSIGVIHVTGKTEGKETLQRGAAKETVSGRAKTVTQFGQRLGGKFLKPELRDIEFKKGVEEIREKTLAGTVPIGFAGPAIFAGKVPSLAGKAQKAGKAVKGWELVSDTTGLRPARMGLITDFAAKVAAQFAKPKFVAWALGIGVTTALTASFGGRVFGSFVGMEEATQAVMYPMSQALREGNFEAYDTAKAEFDELIKDPTMWEEVQKWIPFKNSIDGLSKFRDAAAAGGAVWDKLAEDLRIQQETGETEDEKWARIKQEELDNEKFIIDYYNQERKNMVTWEREAEIAARNEDAAFWSRERERQRKMEAEDRKAMADFWLAYRRQTQQIKEDTRPSNLKFGLL